MNDVKIRNRASSVLIERFEWSETALCVLWKNGHSSTFHAPWLRDNCQDPETRHPQNGQRLFDIAGINGEIRIAQVEADDTGALRVAFSPDGHESRFAAAWLKDNAYDPVSRSRRDRDLHLWGCNVSASLPEVAWAAGGAIHVDAWSAWCAGLSRFGVALITGVPCASHEILKVAEKIGFVRRTNYGEVFDVKAEERPVNLAYTGLGLGLHTDNPYRDPVPGLQLLHCLQSSSSGGETLLSDGFAAAEWLRREDAEAFELLTSWEVPFRYEDESGVLEARARILETDSEGRLRAVHFNSRSASAFDLPEEVVPAFYEAYRSLARRLHAPDAILRLRLEPGQLLVIDNRRVLHGRSAFEGGARHLQGCYVDWDGFDSRWRKLGGEACQRAR